MRFAIEKPKETMLSLARRLGYIPMESNTSNELNFSRPLSRSDYPRFHIYIKEDREKGVFILNLHLDQKKPSYQSVSAHSGEYDGGVVEKEMERIKNILDSVKKREPSDSEPF